MAESTPHVDATSKDTPQLITDVAEVNRIVCRRWIDDFNARNDEDEAAARTDDYIAHAPTSIVPAPMDSDGWIDMLSVFLEGFPDLHITVEEATGDESSVAQRVQFHGTHTGVFQGLPPTNKVVSFGGIELNRMVDGKIAEHWFQLDQVAMMQQLGLAVVPGPRLVPRLIANAITKPFRKRASAPA